MEITMNDVLYVVLTVCVPYALKLLLDYVRLRTASSRYAQAVNAVADAVSATNQVYVDRLKKAGKFDADAQAEARKLATETATQLMSDAVKSYINTACGDLEQWILSEIEATKGRELV